MNEQGQCRVDKVCVLEGHWKLVTLVIAWWEPPFEEEEAAAAGCEGEADAKVLAVVSSSMDRRVRLALVSGWRDAAADPACGHVVWNDEGVAHKDGVTDLAMVDSPAAAPASARRCRVSPGRSSAGAALPLLPSPVTPPRRAVPSWKQRGSEQGGRVGKGKQGSVGGRQQGSR